jgi:hypothetical protein
MKKSALLLGLLVSATSAFAGLNLATELTINGESKQAVASLAEGQVLVAPVSESPAVLLSIATKPSEKENAIILVIELHRLVAAQDETAEPTIELIASVEVEAEFGKEVVIPCPSELAQAELKITVSQE